jgi:hypothetical protein
MKANMGGMGAVGNMGGIKAMGDMGGVGAGMEAVGGMGSSAEVILRTARKCRSRRCRLDEAEVDWKRFEAASWSGRRP